MKDPIWATVAYRVHGESYKQPEQTSDALEAFELKLVLNPKLSIQRRVVYPRKKILLNEL